MARLVDEDEPAPAGGQFRLETLYTGLSAGTELTFFKGTNPYLHAAWDKQLGVFRRDRPATGFPVRAPGYMEVGRVSETSSDAVAVGDLVAMAYGHKTAHTVDPAADRFVPLPHDIDPVLGIYAAHMGPICANGLLHAAAELAGPGALQLGDGVGAATCSSPGPGWSGCWSRSWPAATGPPRCWWPTPPRPGWPRPGPSAWRRSTTPTAPPGGRSRSAGAATPPTAAPTSPSSAGAGRPPLPGRCAPSGPRARSSTSPSTRAERPTWPSGRSSTTTG